MAKPDRFDSAIEKLLEERSQYQEWLDRLSDAGAPDAVRTRVRADYQTRLDGVMAQLRSHEATITAELDRHTAEQAELEERESQVLERLAEAQVRHAVGEFDDKQWNNLSTAQNKELADVRSGLERLRGEVSRLAEVQAVVSASPAPPEPAAPPRFAPKPPPQQQPAPSAAPMSEPPKPHGDELDFLKSVTVEQEQAASLSPAAAEKRRSSGGQPMVTTATPPPESMPQEASQPTTQASAPAPAPPQAQPAPQPAKSSPATGSVKTLKCGECGTLNRPTEWYCERCGAELAAM